MLDKPGEAKSEGPVWSPSEESQRWSLAHARWVAEIEEDGSRRPPFLGSLLLVSLIVLGAVFGVVVVGKVAGLW